MIHRMLAASMLVGLLVPGTLSAATLRLLSRVVVGGHVVKLADLVQAPAGSESTWAALLATDLVPAPEPGRTAWIEVADVQDKLVRKGFDLSQIELIGPRRIEISREQPAQAAKGPEEWATVLERMIRRAVTERPEWRDRQLEVTVESRKAAEYLHQTGASQWELGLPPHWRLGTQMVTLEVPAGSERARFSMAVTLAEVRPVVVARRRILRGSRITPDDLDLVSHAVRTEDSRLLTQVSEAVDMQAARTIEPDRPVGVGDLKSPPLVFRGNRVTVQVRHGTASLDMIAVAKEDGGLGDWIEVVNPASRKPLETKVRVAGFQTAELPAEAPLARSASTSPAARSMR